MALHAHRCLHHVEREAAARCPACRQFFCRECVTEHEGRVLCSDCLAKLTTPQHTGRSSFTWLLDPMLAALGLAMAWIFFYALGTMLLWLPSTWHDGTIWQQLPLE